MGDIDQNDLLLYSGCICCFSALYTAMPGCVGASGKGECLCMQGEVCIKADRLSKDKMILCAPCVGGPDESVICRLGLGCCGQALKKPDKCVESRYQCFCCYGAAALPPSEDVPASCAVCFLALYPQVGCMKKVGDFKAAA